MTASEATLVRDRVTGELVEERVFGGDSLRFLYHRRPGRVLTERVASRPWANHLYGLWQRSPLSRRKIRDFVHSLGIDADEAARPIEQYRSLDDFFTRRLRPGARPIDREPDHLVSPADGRALAFQEVADELLVKGCRVSLAELVDSEPVAARYRGGPALIVRLAPADYHRFHFPDDGRAGPVRTIGDRLHSVHPIALAGDAPSLANKRAISSLTSERFGELLLVEVGAMLVGTIVQTYRPGPVSRGQEKGMFRFGGSTVILLAEPGALVLDDDLVKATEEGVESFVQMGSRVGRAGEIRSRDRE